MLKGPPHWERQRSHTDAPLSFGAREATAHKAAHLVANQPELWSSRCPSVQGPHRLCRHLAGAPFQCCPCSLLCFPAALEKPPSRPETRSSVNPGQSRLKTAQPGGNIAHGEPMKIFAEIWNCPTPAWASPSGSLASSALKLNLAGYFLPSGCNSTRFLRATKSHLLLSVQGSQTSSTSSTACCAAKHFWEPPQAVSRLCQASAAPEHPQKQTGSLPSLSEDVLKPAEANEADREPGAIQKWPPEAPRNALLSTSPHIMS